MSLIFDVHQVYIQWMVMVQNNSGEWIVPENSNCIVNLMVDGQADYDAFLALNRDGQDAQLVAYLQTLYPMAQ